MASGHPGELKGVKATARDSMYPLTAVCMTALPFPDQQVPDPRCQSGVGEGGGGRAMGA